MPQGVRSHDFMHKFVRLLREQQRQVHANFSFDFRSRYWRAKELYYPQLLAQPPDGTLRVCLHIRRGDVALLPVGAKRLIRRLGGPVKGVIGTAETPLPRAFPHVPALVYRAALERLRTIERRRQLQVTVFSDGYDARHYEWARPELASLGFADWGAFARYVKEVEREEFSGFGDAEMVIGEGVERTKRAIHAFVTADVIMRGSGNFSGFFVRSFRQQPPLLYLDLRPDAERSADLVLDEYARRRSRWRRAVWRMRSFVLRYCGL